ncbi:uncharacterized protein ABDE67_021954 [Symphorus nematophorus]
MDAHSTVAPVSPTPFTEAVTEAVITDNEDFAALIGGVVAAVLFLLICAIAVLLWCLSRQKGSYVTNETDEDDDLDNTEDDDESDGSDTALQSKEPLQTKEEE